jgi:hypothetical protein
MQVHRDDVRRKNRFASALLTARCLLLLRGGFDRHRLLRTHPAKFRQLTVQTVPQRAFRPEFFQKGLSPGQSVFADLLIAKKGTPSPLDFIFSKQSITS